MALFEMRRAFSEGRIHDGQQLLETACASLKERGVTSMVNAYRERAAFDLARLGQIDIARTLVDPAQVRSDDSDGIIALAVTGHSPRSAIDGAG